MLLVLLFFVIALGLTIFAFMTKNKIFSYIGFVVWFLFCIYTYPLSTVQWDIYMDFGVIGTLLALVSIVMPFTWRDNLGGEEEEEKPYDMLESLNKDRESIRAYRDRLRGIDTSNDRTGGSSIANIGGKRVIVPKMKRRIYSDNTYD